MRYGFVIDQRKCIGCHACTVACKEENQVPLGVNRTWVKYVEKGTYPDTRRYFAVLRCNHCDSAPCVTICPTVALYRRPDGIVDFDGARCIGCKSCMQACPYDALYIDPETQTAAKCHYCAHRVEVGLEPACVVVCPVQAIISGDLDDEGAEIARLVASQQVQVRKAEKGTRPKLYYLGAEASALIPEMQDRRGGYAFSQTGAIPVPGAPNRPAPATLGDGAVDLVALARTTYDVAHPAAPWGWKVSTYLWAKSVGAGAFLLAALGLAMGAMPVGPLAGIVAPALGLAFLLLTTALLVADLKRPERFLYLLFKPNWRSWLVWGGWILMAAGGVGTLWLWAGVTGADTLLRALVAPMALLALAAAGYSAFLFGQAAGRDFWQSPILLPQLLNAAALAGSAALLLVAEPAGARTGELEYLRTVLFVSLGGALVLLGAEVLGRHPTRDGARAAHLLARGALAGLFWGGVVVAGTLLPMGLLLLGWWPCWMLAAAMALAGLWLYEDLWVRAGQAVPLS